MLKSGVQQAPGPWLNEPGGPVRMCHSSGWSRHLDSSLREGSLCPPAKVAGHDKGVHLVWGLRARLVAWDIPVSETKDNWYWISHWRFLDQCPATLYFSFDELNGPSSLNLSLQVIIHRLVYILVPLSEIVCSFSASHLLCGCKSRAQWVGSSFRRWRIPRRHYHPLLPGFPLLIHIKTRSVHGELITHHDLQPFFGHGFLL